MTAIELQAQTPSQGEPQAQSRAQITIPEETYTRLARAAHAQQLAVEELAEKIIREHLRAIERKEMEREMEAYAAQHAQILEKYGGEYIAMYQGKIVDHDKDELELVLRIDERFPTEIVFMTQVNTHVFETYIIRSPQVTFI